MEAHARSDRSTLPCFAVDIDNVLARAECEIRRLFRDVTGAPFPRGSYCSAGGLDTAALDRTMVETLFVRFHTESIPRLPLMPGAHFALTQLAARYRIIIVTARWPTSRAQTVAWLRAHRLPFDAIYLTQDKAEVDEAFTLAVDDHPEHVTAYCEAGVRVFVMDQPWNRSMAPHPLLTRVSGWDALLQHMRSGTHVCAGSVPLAETPSVGDLLRPPHEAPYRTPSSL